MDNPTYSIKNKVFLHIPDETGSFSYGCDQEWFSTHWKRQAGCGPNVASNMMLYLSAGKRIQLSFNLIDKIGCKALMEAVWTHVTPSMMGVHTIKHFADGLHGFAQERGISLTCDLLEYPCKKKARPSVASISSFIRDGIERDCPVAFLNLSNGAVEVLDAWHWVTIVQLTVHPEDGPIVDIYDGDKTFQVNLATWCETTTGGGGFVRLLSVGEL